MAGATQAAPWVYPVLGYGHYPVLQTAVHATGAAGTYNFRSLITGLIIKEVNKMSFEEEKKYT